MPFDFKAYDQKCNGLTLEELQREWEHYTRLISGAATSTAVSGMAIPLTLGVSTIGVAMAAPAIHNARKKREIIEKHLNKLQATHHTRKRDVLGSMAFSGTIGVVTLGVGSMGADAVATAGAEHGIQAVVANETAIKIVTHAALDGAGMAVEHAHTGHLKKNDALKAFKKAGVFKAVRDAKAAEAGYAAQPYNNHPDPYYAGSNSSQGLSMPPPPYNTAVAQTLGQSSYGLNTDGFPPDLKAPMAETSVPHQGQPYTSPHVHSQQPAPQYFGYSMQHVLPQQQQAPPPGVVTTGPVDTQGFSSPLMPAVGYPPHVWQRQEGIQTHTIPQPQSYMQDQKQSASLTQTPAIPPYSPAASLQTYNMSAMNEALPTQTPVETTPYAQPQPEQFSNAGMPTSFQENMQTYAYHPTPTGSSNQAVQVPLTAMPPPASLLHQPTPQPPPATQGPPIASPNNTPLSVASSGQQSTGLQQPTVQGFSPQYHQHSTYTSPQHTGPYQQTQLPPPPPPPPTYLNTMDSVDIASQRPLTPHPPYNPQQYAPISQHQQTYSNSTYTTVGLSAQSPQSMQTPVGHQGPPLSQTPMGTSVIQYHNDSSGTYYSVPPPVSQSQKPYEPGPPWQNFQVAYQP